MPVWQKSLNERITRRRALAGAAGAGAGVVALSMVGCNGGDKAKVTSDIEVNGGLAVPKDTTAIAVQGGTYKSVTNQDTQTFDVGETSNYRLVSPPTFTPA
jgi:hypothetical protein